jgi:uncharacterized protein YdaT
MPWTKQNYPDSMKNMDSRIRQKAIEIANSLLDDGYEEGRAISISIAQAKKWADNTNEAKSEGTAQHVIPHEKGWAIKKEDGSRVSFTFDNKEKAIEKAKELAENQGTECVIHREDGSIQDTINPRMQTK